ncbi:hypothetical protein R3W88_016479 [Solanum pinnatisectum]|uniref:MADS-box domain-containing protein n=1 Tax=Solanum pinnatisectum TaxID=50273 RepID=A0AAV9KXT0_9SOLN|nr:hypothetical protein R3W88_016479 [Solanum pinnatisectum]
MPRKKVIFALIENETDKKVSYKKRHIGFLEKAQELMTLCEVEMVVIIYSPYSDEPKVFANHGAAISTFRKFKELATVDWKNYFLRHKALRSQRSKLLIKKNLELVREAMKKNVGDARSTSNVPQSTPSTSMTSMIPSLIIHPPLYAPVPSPMTLQMDPSEEIPPMGTLILMNNSQNNSIDIPESPSLIELLNWNNDDLVTLLDDLSLNNINDQDPNPTNNI